MVGENTAKYVRWLNLLDQALAQGEIANLQGAVSHLTAAGTVLEDPYAVYVSEFLEWLAVNLDPGLNAKKDTREYKESTDLMHEAIQAASEAFRRPQNVEKMHETFTDVRYRATQLQLTRLWQLRHRHIELSLARRLEEFGQS
jgi:hypothetical protein